MSGHVGNPHDGFSRDAAHILTTLKILQCLHNIIRDTNVLVHIMIRLQERTINIDKQIGLFLYKIHVLYMKRILIVKKKIRNAMYWKRTV